MCFLYLIKISLRLRLGNTYIEYHKYLGINIIIRKYLLYIIM